MSDVLFRATIEDFCIVPYVRMTTKSKWSKRSRLYLDSQANLAKLLQFRCMKSFKPIDFPCELSFAVHFLNKRVRDLDNVCKALCDALQYAGIVENDRWIHGTGQTRLYFDGKSRIVLELRRLT